MAMAERVIMQLRDNALTLKQISCTGTDMHYIVTFLSKNSEKSGWSQTGWESRFGAVIQELQLSCRTRIRKTFLFLSLDKDPVFSAERVYKELRVPLDFRQFNGNFNPIKRWNLALNWQNSLLKSYWRNCIGIIILIDNGILKWRNRTSINLKINWIFL
jgi:hypothetical protein